MIAAIQKVLLKFGKNFNKNKKTFKQEIPNSKVKTVGIRDTNGSST